ncbi:MAG: hypothetical protein SVZ03_00175 [Spirochaetota bacterium]|nr:hypothetical protein [Spirochaetota bacterium]
MRNKDLIIANLEEAIKQPQEMAKYLRDVPEYSEVELQIDLENAYHHFNYGLHIINANGIVIGTPGSFP